MDDLEFKPLPRFELQLVVHTPDEKKVGIRMFASAELGEPEIDYCLLRMAGEVKGKLREEGYLDGGS